MAWNKTSSFLRDVFSTPKLGPKGGLSEFFRNEYRNEYKNQKMLGTPITDAYVAAFMRK